jgi:hypothetical protein
MNAVEIEEAVSKLAEAPFDPAAFPYAFLEAFGNKETNQNTVCQPTTPKWRHTVERLKTFFKNWDVVATKPLQVAIHPAS